MEEKIKEFRRLIYEPEHESTTCWCEPEFRNEGGTLNIIHHEQRDVLSEFVRQNFK